MLTEGLQHYLRYANHHKCKMYITDYHASGVTGKFPCKYVTVLTDLIRWSKKKSTRSFSDYVIKIKDLSSLSYAANYINLLPTVNRVFAFTNCLPTFHVVHCSIDILSRRLRAWNVLFPPSSFPSPLFQLHLLSFVSCFLNTRVGKWEEKEFCFLTVFQ